MDDSKDFLSGEDFLADETIESTKSVRGEDLLSELDHGLLDTHDAFCNPDNGGCRHPLTAHTRGMILHDRCMYLGCSCKKAVLTENAKRRVKHGLLP